MTDKQKAILGWVMIGLALLIAVVCLVVTAGWATLLSFLAFFGFMGLILGGIYLIISYGG